MRTTSYAPIWPSPTSHYLNSLDDAEKSVAHRTADKYSQARSLSAAAERQSGLLANDWEGRQHHEPAAWKWSLLTGVHTRRKCPPRRMRVRGRWRAEQERYQGAGGGGGDRSTWATCCAAIARAVPPGQAAGFIGRKTGPAPNKGRATRCRRRRAAGRRRRRAGAAGRPAVAQAAFEVDSVAISQRARVRRVRMRMLGICIPWPKTFFKDLLTFGYTLE